jgi:hypothetical protein
MLISVFIFFPHAGLDWTRRYCGERALNEQKIEAIDAPPLQRGERAIIEREGILRPFFCGKHALANPFIHRYLIFVRSAKMQEFSLATTYEYARPLSFSEAKLEEVARSICTPPVGDTVNPLDVVVQRQNPLFSYSLTVPLLNHSGQVLVNAQAIVISFRQGRGDEHLKLMVDLTLNTLKAINPSKSKRIVITFGLHAVLEKAEYRDYMERFVNERAGVVSGGVVLVANPPDCGGELRYTAERSLGYTDGLFFLATLNTVNELSASLFESMAKGFAAIAEVDGIKFAPS